MGRLAPQRMSALHHGAGHLPRRKQELVAHGLNVAPCKAQTMPLPAALLDTDRERHFRADALTSLLALAGAPSSGFADFFDRSRR